MSAPALAREPINPQLLAALRQRLGDRLSTAAAVCAHHGKDESYHQPHAPDAVAFAHSTDEVSALVGLCAEYKTLVFSARVSLEGHVAALKRRRLHRRVQMNRVLRVGVEDLDVTVAGCAAAQRILARHRPVLPDRSGADASLGGMAATRASGTNAVRYARCANVLSLTVVPDGGICTSRGSQIGGRV